MPITALYRINGGEVLKISLTGQTFADRDPAYFGVLTDPVTPNGTAVRETTDGMLGPMRQFGFAKIAIPALNTALNALQAEISTFAAAEASDDSALDATAAQRWIDTPPRYRKVFKALLKRLVAETNADRVQWNGFRAQVAAATNLTDLKNRVANNTSNLPTRTLDQAVTALLADISAGD